MVSVLDQALPRKELLEEGAPTSPSGWGGAAGTLGRGGEGPSQGSSLAQLWEKLIRVTMASLLAQACGKGGVREEKVPAGC